MTNGVGFLRYCQEILPLSLQSSHSLFCTLCVSLTVPRWNPWINNSRHRFFIFMTEYDIYPLPDLATHLSEGAHKTPYASNKTFWKPSTFFSPLTAPGSSLEPQNVVSAPLELLCFLLSILYSPPSSPSHTLLSASCCESETVTNSDKKASDLDTSPHLNNGATWYESLVIRALLAHCVLRAIRQ